MPRVSTPWMKPTARFAGFESADRTASLVTSVPRRSRWDRPDSNYANGSLCSPFSSSNPCSSVAGAREGARASKWDRPDSNRSQTCSFASLTARDSQGSNRPTELLRSSRPFLAEADGIARIRTTRTARFARRSLLRIRALSLLALTRVLAPDRKSVV